MSKKNNNDMVNFYEHDKVKKLLTQTDNPHFDLTQISLPARLGVIAPSGTGKTNWLLNFLRLANDTFNHIFVCLKAPEPLYEFLQKQIGDKNITFYYKLGELPEPNDLPHKGESRLVVFDDQIAETDKNQTVIKNYYIRGRKLQITSFYLSQSYFRVPKIIRLQFNYLIILKLSSMKDLKLFLTDYGLGIDKEKLLEIYKDATKEKFNFLKIDIEQPDNNFKFSHNFKDFYQVESEV